MKMKKKIVSLCLVAALAVTAIGSASLAYMTDSKKAVNNFTIGNVSIDLKENGTSIGSVAGENNDVFNGLSFENVMPTQSLDKEVTVTNKSTEDAYVRVAVVMNNVEQINDAIDEVYEKLYDGDEQKDAKVQAVYDEVFKGWDLSYAHYDGEPASIRLWMNETAKSNSIGDGVSLWAIDSIQRTSNGQVRFDHHNEFLSADENTIIVEPDHEMYAYNLQNGQVSYYDAAVENNERVYVFYMKLEDGATAKLFDGLTVPADFDNNRVVGNGKIDQMAMFKDLQISVYADAIQSTGFANATAAFTALQEAHPMGWWN